MAPYLPAVIIKLIYDIQAGWIHMDTYPLNSNITYLHTASLSQYPLEIQGVKSLLMNVFQFSVLHFLKGHKKCGELYFASRNLWLVSVINQPYADDLGQG